MGGEFLGDCRTPEQWCRLLRSRDVVMSARRLRAHARKQGQFYRLGRTMLLHVDHLEAILRAEALGAKTACATSTDLQGEAR